MPEGDTIHRAAAALRSALVDEQMVRFEAPRLIGITPRAGRTDRVGREPRQAPRGAVGRRRHPAHPHADERVVAPLPRGRELAAPAPPAAGPDRGRGLAGGVLQRPGRRDVPPARRHPPSRARRPRARPRPRRRRPRTAASSCCAPTTTRTPPSPRCCSTSGCSAASATCSAARCSGPASSARSPRSATSRRPTPCASSTSPPRCCGPTSHGGSRASVARRPGWPRRLRPHRPALPALRARPSRPAARRPARPRPVLVPGLPGPLRPPPQRPRRHPVDARRQTDRTRRPASSSPIRPGAAPADRIGGSRAGGPGADTPMPKPRMGPVSAAPCGG